ncbi:complement C1q domain-containing protein [bacterium]|nr:complement C1q domain-containing protein [bacterium]
MRVVLKKNRLICAVLLAVLCAGFSVLSARAYCQSAVTTAFTYQGTLKDAGAPADGSYDFSFALYDDATAGAQIGSTLNETGVAVVDGLFAVSLDFGAGAFDGDARWLEISVGPNGGSLTLLSPRREIHPAPQARFSVEADYATTSTYAMTAGDADTLDGLDSTDLQEPHVSFAAHLGADWFAGASQTVVFDVEEHDHGGNYNHLTGEFTAPTDGVYLFSLSAYNMNGAGFLQVNGTDWTLLAFGDSVGGGSRLLNLAAGDVVSIRNSNVLPGTSFNYTSFSGVQLY